MASEVHPPIIPAVDSRSGNEGSAEADIVQDSRNPYKCISCNSCHEDLEDLLVHKLSCHVQETRFFHPPGDTKDVLQQSQSSPSHNTPNEDLAYCGQSGLNDVSLTTLDAETTAADRDVGLADLPSECVVCSQTFQPWRALEKHMQSHDPAPTDPDFFKNCRMADGTLQCLICGVYKQYIRSLRVHFAVHTNERIFACPKCPARFKTSQHFVEHFKRTHTSLCQVLRCDLCDYTTTYGFLLRKHKLKHEGIVLQDRCEVCFKMFASDRIMYHYMIHTGETPHVCATCGKGYRYRSLLKKHVVSIHLGVKRKYEHRDCPICGARSLLRNFEAHMRRHTDEPTNICCVCSRPFYSWERYLIHMERMHVRIKDRKCPVCHRAFYSRSEVQQHVRVHIDEKLYNCEVCGKAFKWKNKIRDHMKTHSEERPFKCELCGEAFKWKHNLANHVRARHK